MSIGTYQYLENHGNQGIILTDEGTLVTDRYLLDTCTAISSIRKDQWGDLPNIGASHPIFGWITMEKRELSFKGSFAVARCSYAGVVTDTTPVYELVVGTNQDPISTHPKFVTDIGGSAMQPLNRAIFKYAGGGVKLPNATKNSPAASNDGYVFDSFEVIDPDSGGLNPFAKFESYLDSSAMTFRKTYNIVGAMSDVDISAAGYIDVPDGPAPDLANPRNWLNMGYTITQRGAAVQVVVDWRASGPRGWNTTVYTA